MAEMPKERPEKSLHLEDSDITLTMTYVVMSDILRFVGNIDTAVTAIMTDQDTRDLIIRRLLTDSKKPVKELDDLIPSEEVEIDIFDMDDIMAWVLDHVTYFFMKMADKIGQSVEKYPEMMLKKKTFSNLSEDGSTSSQTQTKSAGPTE